MSNLAAILASDRVIELDRPCGVYFLMLGAELVYIGSSVNIAARVTHHRSDKVFDRVLWLKLPPTDLLAYEGALIRALVPRESFLAPRNIERDAAILAEFGLTRNAQGLAQKPTDDDDVNSLDATELVHCRTSPEIKELLRTRAAQEGLSQSAYVRQVIYREIGLMPERE